MQLCGQSAVCQLSSGVVAGRCFAGAQMVSAGAEMAKAAVTGADGTVRGRWLWDDVVGGALSTECGVQVGDLR